MSAGVYHQGVVLAEDRVVYNTRCDQPAHQYMFAVYFVRQARERVREGSL